MSQNPTTRILAIESSCDETAAAVIENGTHILSNIVASQEEIHAKYGGVFPEVASRKHIEVIYPIVEEAMAKAHIGYDDLDCIARYEGAGASWLAASRPQRRQRAGAGAWFALAWRQPHRRARLFTVAHRRCPRN
jgi:hypothetical protein